MHTIRSHFVVINGPAKQNTSHGGYNCRRIQMPVYLQYVTLHITTIIN